MHKSQLLILKTLQYKSTARFSELNIFNMSSDRFSFHLNKLVRDGFITKSNLQYKLSNLGKEFINRTPKQAKIGIALHCVRTKNTKEEYLIHKREKEPFRNWYGSVSGKVLFGENPIETAKRILKIETGLKGNFTLKGIAHYTRLDRDKILIEDEYFWVYRVNGLVGHLKRKTKQGENTWLNEDKIRKIKNIFASFEEMKEFNNSNTLLYIDRKKSAKGY